MPLLPVRQTIPILIIIIMIMIVMIIIIWELLILRLRSLTSHRDLAEQTLTRDEPEVIMNDVLIMRF